MSSGSISRRQMHMRRFTRLPNACQKLENRRAAADRWLAFYNLCRVHETLRCTPTMALDLTDHVWSIAALCRPRLAHSAQK
jgi:hypothetical protein